MGGWGNVFVCSMVRLYVHVFSISVAYVCMYLRTYIHIVYVQYVYVYIYIYLLIVCCHGNGEKMKELNCDIILYITWLAG